MAIRARGPAYPFWERVQRELDRSGMTQAKLCEAAEVHPAQIQRLAWSAPRDRESRRRQVLSIAKVLKIPQKEALRLAGLAPREPEAEPAGDVREDIIRSKIYTEKQKRALLELLDVFDESNAAQRDVG